MDNSRKHKLFSFFKVFLKENYYFCKLKIVVDIQQQLLAIKTIRDETSDKKLGSGSKTRNHLFLI